MDSAISSTKKHAKKVQERTWQKEQNSIKRKQRMKNKKRYKMQMIRNAETVARVHTHTGNLKTIRIKYKKQLK